MKTRSGEKMKLTSYDELFGISGNNSGEEIYISEIKPFKDHPFKVVDDEKMELLVESIRQNGIVSPVLVRPSDGGYEMISGHRRMHAAVIVGIDKLPAIVKKMNDDEATIAMVDSNIQREELLPSERAFAYKMKLEAMKHQGQRTDRTSAHNEQKLKGTTSRSIVAGEVGISPSHVSRYIRLTELIPELLQMVDNKRLSLAVAAELSYLDDQLQGWTNEYINDFGMVKQEQLMFLRDCREGYSFSHDDFLSLMKEKLIVEAPKKQITLTQRKLNQIFPAYYSQTEIEKIVFSLLEEWKQKQNKEH